MAERLHLPLGAPGIHRSPESRLRELGGVRMDIAAFVGVAPRGPVRERVLDEVSRNGQPDSRWVRRLRRTVPVVVESFDDYRRWFGGFEGPGLLPYAVASFFENGGRRAYVARIVHQYATAAENGARKSLGTVAGVWVTEPGNPAKPLQVRARSEGVWGNGLRASMEFRYSPLNVTEFALVTLRVPEGTSLGLGATLRLTLSNGAIEFRSVTVLLEERGGPTTPGSWSATLSAPASALPVEAEIVEASLTIEDSDDARRTEKYSGIGLNPVHPRWLRNELAHDSRLVVPDESWPESCSLEPWETPVAAYFSGGVDDYAAIVPEDFFDTTWVSGDEEPGDGVTSVAGLADLSLLVVPDLYSPGPLAPVEPVVPAEPPASPQFETCGTRAAWKEIAQAIEVDLTGLRLDPETDLAEIERWQRALVDFATEERSFIVLLDVPPRLSPRQIQSWRGRFHSAYAAAYHPWLKVTRTDDARDTLIEVTPSAAAAGIIAQREIALGVPHGPANVLTAGVVDVSEVVADAIHDDLHPLGINVFLRERDGIRLTAARTLSRETAWRQLSVRRLVTMIRRALEQQMEWVVFEPNNARLRSEMRRLVSGYLRRLFQAGAFRGATEQEAFFVRCDEGLNPRQVVDAGQLITHVGVAPAEPLEFIVLRLLRDGDGTLTLED